MNTQLPTRYSGSFDPFHPEAAAIDPRDIAAGLAGRFRWGRQTCRHTTVAQHCVECSIRLDRFPEEGPCDLARWGLLHDAAEAWLSDVPTPIKSNLGWIQGNLFVSFTQVERRILRAVAERFGLPWPIPDPVWRSDERLRATEYRDLFDGPLAVPLGIEAQPFAEPLGRRWSAYEAEAAWLARFDALWYRVTD